MEYLSSSGAEKVAVIIPQEDRKITYGELSDYVMKLALFLRDLGLEKGSSIAIMLPNGAEVIAAFLAVVECNHIAFPLNPTCTAEELEYALIDAQVVVLLVPMEHSNPAVAKTCSHLMIATIELQFAIVPLFSGDKIIKKSPLKTPNGTCLGLHTSGSTSQPKLVPLTRASLWHSAEQLAQAYKLGTEDNLLLVMPLFHVHGLIGNLLVALASGGQVIVPLKFSASQFVPCGAQYKVTWLSAVPTIYQILLAKSDLYLPQKEIQTIRGTLKFIRSCSASLSLDLRQQLHSIFGVPIIQAYSMTETAHLAATGIPGDQSVLGSSAGKPLAREIKLVKGEICIRGYGIMERYLKPDSANPTAFTEDGYFRTGDLGHFDEDGNLVIEGRLKELINRGGEKINPLEVETVIMNSNLVQEAVVFPIADPIYGEAVACIAVPKEGEEHSNDELKRKLLVYCSSHLSSFKCPTQIIASLEIPKSSIGKIQRALLGKKFGSQQI